MTIQTKQHLNEDQILWAIADEMRLPDPTRRHLLNCPDCRHEKQKTENAFFAVGETARRLGPASKCRPMLPPETRRFGYRRPLLAGAVSILLALMVGWWVMPPTSQIDTAPQYTAVPTDGWEDEALMSEITKLTENPLPEPYAALISGATPSAGEDYMEYLVPSLDDQPISRKSEKKFGDFTKKGGLLC